jgi:hypothetical protein
MKGKCIYLDYETNSCYLHYGEQCEGKQACDDYEEEEK